MRLNPLSTQEPSGAIGLMGRWCSCAVLLPVLLLLLPATAERPRSPEFDVLVYGATPGGTAAAVAAGREGSRVGLVEPGLYVGGALSGGLGQADYGPHARRVMGARSISTEFFRRVAAHYNVSFFWPPDGQCSEHRPPWVSEPHVAERVLRDMLGQANVTVLLATRISLLSTAGGRVVAAYSDDGRKFRASVWVDGSYEGALMRLARVSYTWGREANTTYNESAAGRLPTLAEQPEWTVGDRSGQLPRGISPWTDGRSNSTPINGVWAGPVAIPGGADSRVGGYDWRVVLTDLRSNRVSIPEPDRYDPADYELIRRAIAKGWQPTGPSFSVPNRKTDWKMFDTFGEFPNSQWEYPNATYERQQQIVAEFKQKALGLLKFFREDSAVPAGFRAQMAGLGLCRDEFERSSHWMSQLYVRSALRMVGRRVLTQRDVVQEEFRASYEDGIGLGAYTVDVPGPAQTIIDPVTGDVVNEGALKVPAFCAPTKAYPRGIAPFLLPYSVMLPKRGEVSNLLVPVALSASHVAFNSIRMEPTWMVLGQSAGVAAAMAARMAISVADLDVALLRERLRHLGQLLEPLPPH